MADPAGVQIEGGRELRRTMKQAGEDMQQMKDAHAAAARIAAAAARGKTPVGETGNLAASVRSSGTTTAGILRAGKASVPYAGPIHWGWPSRNITAQPFLADGASSTEPVWVEAYAQAVNRILAKIRGD